MRVAASGSVASAAELRAKVAAAAELAKRAGVDAVEWELTARDSERALGRLLEAGRDAGDIHDGHRHGITDRDSATLADLDLNPNLAADAVAFARVPDDVWSVWVGDGREHGVASRASFVRAARAWLAEKDAADSENARRRDVLARRRDDLARATWVGLGTRLPAGLRRDVVAALTELGLSTRAIAPIVGVSDYTVRSDIAGARNLAPYPADDSDPVVDLDTGEVIDSAPTLPPVVGIDGKTYRRPDSVRPFCAPEPVASGVLAGVEF